MPSGPPKAPLDKADLYQGKKTLTFGGIKFHVMGLFGEHADRLYDYVSRAARPNQSRRPQSPRAASASSGSETRSTTRTATLSSRNWEAPGVADESAAWRFMRV